MTSIKDNKIVLFTKELFTEFGEDNVMSLAASLAYYTVFSLAPILVIISTVAGIFLGEEASRGEIYGQLQGLMGEQAANQIQEMVANVNLGKTGIVATVVSIGSLIFGATGVFNELKTSLNRIWGVKAKPKNGVLAFLKDRLLSFAMVVSLGFISLVALVLSAAVAVIGGLFAGLIPEAGEIVLQGFNLILSVGITTFLFAAVFKALPDVQIKYSDVWKGALFTAILFNLGKFLIGLYIGKSDIGGTYGAAGSIVVILLWVYYSSVILFMGAEFTYVYASRYGSKIRPSEHAVLVEIKEVPDNAGNSKKDTNNKPNNANVSEEPIVAQTAAHRR
jgi:membrane protein